MREIVEDCEFDKGERVTLFKQHSERFIVRASVNKNRILREKDFIKYKDAEDFYDSFIDGKNVRDFLNEMLIEVNKEGKYVAALL